MVNGGVSALLAAVHDRLSDLAAAMYAVESDPDVAFVRSLMGGTGAAAATASGMVASADRLWELYPLVKDAVDRADAALNSRDEASAGQALGANAIRLPDGSLTSAADLIGVLQHDAEALLRDARSLATTARTTVAAVDAASATMAALEKEAADLGAATAAEVAVARAAVARAVEAVETDPTTPGAAAGLDDAIEQCRALLIRLSAERSMLPAALAEADAEVHEIETLVDEGREALDVAQAKILRPSGLLGPLDRQVVDGTDRALRPWLGRIRAEAENGSWRSASVALQNWKAVADATLANARRIAQVNKRPVERRNELRGLLDAYRAKAAARGGSENDQLDKLYRHAHDVLHVAPCDLPLAERLVASYVDAVNGLRTGDRT